LPQYVLLDLWVFCCWR